MKPLRRAVIDVGTNSVKLLIAEVEGREIRPVFEQSRQTRLGQGFYPSHRLQSGPIGSTAEAVAGFAAKARQEGAASIRAVATSAARDAVNRDELTSAIERAGGLKVEIISGEQEADWGFRGVTTDPALARAPLLLLDVGGGSTEFIFGRGEHQQCAASFQLGTVRLLESLPHSEPPRAEELQACRGWLQDFFHREVRPRLGPILLGEGRAERGERTAARGGARLPPSPDQTFHTSSPTDGGEAVQLVGTGGTASILGCMEAELETFDRERLEATRLNRERLSWHVERLWGLPLEERKRVIGLPPNRADVILTGVAIYERVLAEFGFRELRLTTRGLRYAALMD